jgi:hypothetical protein
LRSLSERSDQYFYGLNALKDDEFGIHILFDLQWQQMRKIFMEFKYTGKKGEVSQGGMERLCDDIGRDLCQVSTHRLQRRTKQKDSRSTEKWNHQLFFIKLGRTTQEGRDMVVTKAGRQFGNHSLVKFPTSILKLNKEERERMSNFLIHCKAEARLECLSSFPKQMPVNGEAGPPPKTNVTQVLPSQLDDQLFQDIGCIFRGEQQTISRYERRRLKRLLKIYLDVVLSATLLVPATTTIITVKVEPATETTAAQHCLQPEEALEDIDMMSSVQEFVAKHFDRRKRTVELEYNNGRNTTLVARPFSKDEKSFVDEAKRSKWINQMLPNDAYIRGMCVYLFGWRQDIYKDIARSTGVNILTTIPFGNTMAISSELGLRSGQLRDLRSLLKTQGVQLEMPDKDADRLNREVGNITSNDPVCVNCDYDHPEGDKESCNYCIVPIE